MKFAVPSLACAVFMTLAPVVQGAPLTPRECNSYPFVRTNAPITRHQVQRELRELEQVGYRPPGERNTYPDQIRAAEHRLMDKYQRDCSGMTVAPANNSL